MMVFILEVQFWEMEILIIFEPVLSFESELGFSTSALRLQSGFSLIFVVLFWLWF